MWDWSQTFGFLKEEGERSTSVHRQGQGNDSVGQVLAVQMPRTM